MKLRLSSLRHRWPYLTQTRVTSSHSDIGDRRRYWLSWLNSLVLLHPYTLLFGFPIFRFWAYLMKVILSVPDEGYFERTRWRLFWAYQMKVILSVPDEGYFQTKDYKIGICCFSTKHTALWSKSKDRLARNQNNVSQWSDMSTRGLLFQWTSTIKIQLSMLV
jgi:hypothetical protein